MQPTINDGIEDPIPQMESGDPLAGMRNLIAGNTHLIQNPKILSGLLNAQATPAEAASVDQFLAGMRLAHAVKMARFSGEQINLTSTEQSQLAALNVPYADVQYSAAAAQQEAKSHLLADVKQGMAASAAATPWWKSALNAVTSNKWSPITYINDGVNAVSGLANWTGVAGQQWTGNGVGATASQEKQWNEQAMIAQGYDPHSAVSIAAFNLSGKAMQDPADLYQHYDPQLVDKMIAYSGNPQAYIDKLFKDPTLSADEIATQLNALSSQQASDILAKLGAGSSSMGNIFAYGIDPVKHPDWHTAVAVPTGIIASAMVDPLSITSKGVTALRATATSLDKLGDAASARSVITGQGLTATGRALTSTTRRGFAQLLDSGSKIREANAAGDLETLGRETAKANALIPGLMPLLPYVTGSARRIVDYAEDGTPIFGAAKPITNADEMADFVADKVGGIRIAMGKPINDLSSLSPFGLSRFGARFIRATVGDSMYGVRSGVSKVLNLAKRGNAAKVLADEADEVDASTGEVLAGSEPLPAAGLASKARAARDAVLAGGDQASADAGEAIYQANKGLLGTARRTLQVARRLGVYLPRDMTFDTSDPQLADKVFRYANMYLGRSTARELQGRILAGTEGEAKSILLGMQLQTLHAAGFAHTKAGSDFLGALDRQVRNETYSVTGDKFVDPETGLERDAAMWNSQVQQKMTLVGFSDLQKYGAKLGIYAPTVGRVMNSAVVDTLMKVMRTGWITTPAGAIRNALEDSVMAGSQGKFLNMMAAKAVGRAALPGRTSAAPFHALMARLQETRAGKPLSMAAATAFAPFRVLGRVFDKAVTSADDERGLAYIADQFKTPQDLYDAGQDFFHGRLDTLPDGGRAEATAAAKAGFIPNRIRFGGPAYRKAGFDAVDVDGEVGVERYAAYLKHIIDGNATVVRAILKNLSGSGTVDDVVQALKDDPRTLMAMRSNLIQTGANQWRRTANDDERDLAIQVRAEQQINELKYLLTGRNGKLSEKLVNEIMDSDGALFAPDADWIAGTLKKGELPESTLSPTFAPLPVDLGSTRVGAIRSIANALNDGTGAAYSALVERPMERMTTGPLYMMNYGRARVALEPYERDLQAAGLSAETTDTIATGLAHRAAYSEMVKYVDNPQLRTALDVTGRNFLSFSRATQGFLRRWARNFIEDPVRLHRTAMLLSNAQQGGLVYTDSNGTKQIVLPGTGGAMEAVMKAERMFGLGAGIPGPIPDLTAKFSFLNSGIQNPLQFSINPFIMWPARSIANAFPQHRTVFDELDTFLNGDQSAGTTISQDVQPTIVKKFTDLISDDKDSVTASALQGAMLNLAAGGHGPQPTWDAGQQQTYLHRLQAQTKNMLFTRAAFSLISPSPPGEPDVLPQDARADAVFMGVGARSLKDEYRKIVDETGGDLTEANAIWSQLHPDDAVYTVSSTSNANKSATVNATKASIAWIQANHSLFDQYPGVAAYLVPPATQAGAFDQGAYRAELELGIKQHKDSSQYLSGLVTANSAATYYEAVANRDAAIAADPANAKQINASFQSWKTDVFNKLNPVFAEQQASYETSVSTAKDQVSQLRRLVADPSLPADIPAGELAMILNAYDSYHGFVAVNGGNTQAASANRAQAGASYQQWWTDQLAEFPQLASLYSGVFRTIDASVLDPYSQIGG